MKRLVVGVLAHVDSGKTTLSEALLYRAGSIRKLGRVDPVSYTHLGFDLHAIPAVLLGGGASVVSRHLSPKDGLCKTIFLLDDKVNAVGFERALTAVSRRKSEA